MSARVRSLPRPVLSLLFFFAAALLFLILSLFLPGKKEAPVFSPEARERLVMKIRLNGISDEDVLNAMAKVPRHEFVLGEHLANAYDDRPLPIGYGQTISQPYIVALMTELLELKEDDRVLEIGAGSGYQAAILAELVKEVYTIEIIEPLAEKAQQTLAALDYQNIYLKVGDGYFGWEEKAPFDAIIVTAAPEHVPPPLQRQLADGGRLVIPIGPAGAVQTLWKYTKEGDSFLMENHGLVRFVPFTRESGSE